MMLEFDYTCRSKASVRLVNVFTSLAKAFTLAPHKDAVAGLIGR